MITAGGGGRSTPSATQNPEHVFQMVMAGLSMGG